MKTASKTSSRLSKFFTTSPLQTAFGILIIFSLLANIGLLLFAILLHFTSDFDLAMYRYSVRKACNQDYSQLLTKVGEQSTNSAQGQKAFAAAVCFRDATTGKSLDINSVQPVK